MEEDLKLVSVTKYQIGKLPYLSQVELVGDQGTGCSLMQELTVIVARTTDLRKKNRKNMFKGKSLTVFEIKEVTEEAPETETSPSHRVWNLLSV